MKVMIMRFFAGFFLVSAASACNTIDVINPKTFCKEFEAIAACHCSEAHLPARICRDTQFVYSQMIKIYGTQENACYRQQHKNHTPPQTCMQQWDYYRSHC